MTQRDFEKILEDFPGRQQLALAKDPEWFIFKSLNFQFLRILELLKEVDLSLDEGDEEKWFKVLSFFAIAYEIESDANDDVPLYFPKDEEIFDEYSLKLAQLIKEKFNEKVSDGELEDLIGGVNIAELIDFAKSGESLF